MANGSSGTVLLVTRDSATIRLLESSLGNAFVLPTVGDAADALDRLSDTGCDAVIIDSRLPDQDGHALCMAIRQNHRLADTPVIFVADPGDRDAEARCLELGAADCVTASASPAVLLLRVRYQVEAKHARDELRWQVATDGLTGLANRRQFDEVLEREWRRLGRTGEKLSLVLADIDHFKDFNDNYGHIAGDDCLRQVAHALRQVVNRAADLPARYGGEEFVCVLPDTDAPGAYRIGERLREAVARLDIRHEHSPVAPCVTISVGSATGECRPGHSPLGLLAIADEQLYVAKNAGRNRVASASLP